MNIELITLFFSLLKESGNFKKLFLRLKGIVCFFFCILGLRMSIINSLDFKRYVSFITINFDLSLLQNAYYLKTIWCFWMVVGKKDKAVKHMSKFIGWVNKKVLHPKRCDIILCSWDTGYTRYIYRLYSYMSLFMLYVLFNWSDVQRNVLVESDDAYRKKIVESFTEGFTNWSSRLVKVWQNYPWHCHLQRRSREFLQTFISYMFLFAVANRSGSY